jgi:hypothetical protein
MQLVALDPDPDHPNLVRIHAWARRSYTITAEDGSYRWKSKFAWERAPGRRPSDEFFERSSSSTTEFYLYPATLANYFGYDFGNQTSVQALEVVPDGTRFEFARGAPVVVPVRVVVHHDPETIPPFWKKFDEAGRRNPLPRPPTIKFADRPGEVDFWGVRVESAAGQAEKYPEGRNTVTTTIIAPREGDSKTTTYQPPRLTYRVVDLSPSAPYAREIDLGRLADFSRPGEYRVQIIYSSGGHPDEKKDEWDGLFTGPVFTVVIRD